MYIYVNIYIKKYMYITYMCITYMYIYIYERFKPFFANLFLYYYKNKQMKKMKKNDIRCKQARRFANTFRLIDNLTALSDGGEFEQKEGKSKQQQEIILRFVSYN